MAKLKRSSGLGEESKLVAFKISAPAPHRQLGLFAITIILNTLLWSSIFCFVLALYQIASDSDDASNTLPGVLTLIAAVMTIIYTIVHTTYSVKQRALTYQQLDPRTVKKTTYIANRLVVSLCVLWLLTVGWNMILVARRPTCLLSQGDGQSWEAGTTCLVSRVGMALAMIALIGALTLFGMMAAVRRPFEAHLFKYGQRQPTDSDPTPPIFRRSFESHAAVDKFGLEGQAFPSAHTRSTSSFTNADVETLDLNASQPASVMQSPTRDRAGLGIFTSPFAPPPLPPAFRIPVHSPPFQSPHSDPLGHHRRLSLTPRTVTLLAPAAYVPHSIPIEFSASAQRAVNPKLSSHRPMASPRSQPHLRSMSSFSHRHHSSRSSASLSRPHRPSSSTPVPHLECISRSATPKSSEAITHTDESPNSRSRTSPPNKRAATEIVYIIANNTPIPSPHHPSTARKHWRSASASDATSRARLPHSGQRMAMGWKPHLDTQKTPPKNPLPTNLNQLVRSASAELLSRFTPSADEWKTDFEHEVETGLNAMHVLPISGTAGKSLGTDTEMRGGCGGGPWRAGLEVGVRFGDGEEGGLGNGKEVRRVRSQLAFI